MVPQLGEKSRDLRRAKPSEIDDPEAHGKQIGDWEAPRIGWHDGSS